MAWWRSGYGIGLATPKVAGSTPGLTLSGNNLGQVVHTHVPLSPSSIIGTGQRAEMPCIAAEVTVGLTSHWPCVTDFSGLSAYGITA